MASLGFLQLLCPPVPHAHQGKGGGIARGTCELLGSVISFCLGKHSDFNASVQDHSGVFKVFLFSVN